MHFKTLIITLLLLTAATYQNTIQSKINKSQHILNGNIHSTGITFLHWNKGPAHFHRKIDEVTHIINTHRPHIISLSEANITTNPLIQHIKDYTILITLMSQTTHISRTALIIHNSIKYTRRHDLEDTHTSTIWVELNIPHHKNILTMAGYRQWRTPKQLNIQNSHTNTQQKLRLLQITTQWTKALAENKNTITLMDTNIDTSHNSDHNKKQKIQPLHDIFTQHINTHSLVIHNNTPTHHSNNTSSTIDHITSNCPLKIHNTTTHTTGASDHSIITAIYKTKQTMTQPNLKFKRQHHLLTEHTLTEYINNSQPLQEIFQHTCPNIIAETLQQEINTIINTIAPRKITQIRKNYAPHIDTETLTAIHERKRLHNIAKTTQEQDNWRHYRNHRNQLNKLLKNKKQQYFSDKFNSTDKYRKDMWTTLKDITNTNKQQTPRAITHNNTLITSTKQIANIANTHFINKINNIRNAFTTNTTTTPIQILQQLIPRTHQTLIIPPITLRQTQNIIKKAKSSHSTGHDQISMYTLKKINTAIAPHITHMVNSIINTSTFPHIFKISRITPISKPNKPITDIDSYRPINNMCTLDKIVEQHIKTHITNFITKHNIIHQNHHGGIQDHSTTTALTQIYNTLQTQYEKSQITAILQTDLSAAFDTVDTDILTQKLEHYGFRDKSLKLIHSYLTERTQFVQIDTASSQTLKSPECSVIQGGKLSGLLYTLYTNEVPLLHKLIDTNTITTPSQTSFTDIEHSTVNFVDDSTNMISSVNPTHITQYLTQFYTLIHTFYTINKLKINPQKTELILTCKPKLRQQADQIDMTALGHQIKQQHSTKILGAIITSNLSHDKHIKNTVKNIHNRLHTLRHIKNCTNFDTRLLIANSTIIGTLNYILPLMINCTDKQMSTLQTLLMSTARTVIGHSCFKWSTYHTLKTCKWHSIPHLITTAALKLTHKIVCYKTPTSLHSLLDSRMEADKTTNTLQELHTRRLTRKIYPQHKPTTVKLSQTLLHKALLIYNTLPTTLTILNTSKFNIEIQHHVAHTFPPDKIYKHDT